MQTTVHIELLGHRPCPETARQGVPGGVLISMQDQAADWTYVLPVPQRLWHDRAASATFLARSSRIHSHNLRTGAFSLVLQDAQELAPASVLDRAVQPAWTVHRGDGQGLHCDETVATGQIQCDLVMGIASLVGNVRVQRTNPILGLAAPIAAALGSGEGPLTTAQFGQRILQETRILDDLALGRGQEPFETHVDPGCRIVATDRNSNVLDFAGEDRVPLVSLALDRNSLDLAVDGSMQPDPDFADELDVELGVFLGMELDAVAVGWEHEGRKSILALEARESGLGVLLFHAPEEVLVTRVETAQCALATGGVHPGEIATFLAAFGKPLALRGEADGAFLSHVDRNALVKGIVVQASMRFECDAKSGGLAVVGLKPILEPAPHSFSLLGFDVPSYSFLAYVSDGCCVVTATPKCWQPRTQLGKLGAQIVRRTAFESIHDFGNAPARVGLDEQVHVIGHDFQCVDPQFQFLGLGAQKRPEPVFDLANENGPSVLGAPNDVIL